MKRMLLIMMVLAGLLTTGEMRAQTAQTFQIAIWDGTDNTSTDRKDAILYGFLPAKPNGKAVIVCPGGGYQGLCMDYEGTDFAKWFNELGIAGFVLKYRMPAGRNSVPLSDAERAITIVRENAEEWHIDPKAVGIMGSSAGGHLAATTSTLYSSLSTRPDFQILLYPVITMDAAYTHMGSRTNLLGSEPTTSQVRKFSCEKNVTTDTPQAFIAVSSADELVPVQNSLQYAQALINKNRPVSLHVWPGGFHGFGHLERFEDYEIFHRELQNWLEQEVKATLILSDYQPDHSTKLLVETSQLSDNCYWVYPSFDMSVAMLLDEDKLTHFHSDATNSTPLSNLNQYIQMDLREAQTCIQLYFAGRQLGQVGNSTIVTTMSMVNTPNHIILLATNTPDDEASWEQVAEITEGFPGVCDAGEFYSQPIVFDTPYRYLRMVVKGAEQSAVYWNMSELQVYPCTKKGATAVHRLMPTVQTGGEVYSIDGRLQQTGTEDTSGLSSGLYIMKGKKVILK